MGKRFSEAFKNQAVKKALSCSATTGTAEIAKDLGIGYSTLKKWMYQAERENIAKSSASQRPSNWSVKDRFKAVQATYNLTETELGGYCREHGIYPHHITEWQNEFENMTNPQEQLKAEREEKRQLKAEVKSLQKELRRKEKALAEASALLVLQKKAQAIWGDPEDI